MLKQVTFFFLVSFVTLNFHAQEILLNLDFEQCKNNYPAGCEDFGYGTVRIVSDSVIVQKGRYSVFIENVDSKDAWKAIAIQLPHNYKGKNIRLSGYIKTENVRDGYAGLWMRIDPEIAFDNMDGRGIKGTTEWMKYEVSLPLDPKRTDQIVVGGLLIGRGKMWLDNLSVSVDGKDLTDEKLELFVKELLPADKDTLFDIGSGIDISDLSDFGMSNLVMLGRIWGFLKYHHPEVGKGNYNWDYELFRVLPEYLTVKTIEERDAMLIHWIRKYGTISKCKKCNSSAKNVFLKPDLSWIESFGMKDELKALLHDIYENRFQGHHYYIDVFDGIGNPEFKNEKSYQSMSFPDDGFRLLALYKYWNMIEYFFPYKYQTDKNWNVILPEYLPKVINASNELEYELAMLQLIGEVHDCHANLWRGGDKIADLRGDNYAPFKTEFIEGKLVVTDYYNSELAEMSKLKVGDVITYIDGRSVESIVDSLRPYYPSSNESAMLRDISEDILYSTEKSVALKYISEEYELEVDLALFSSDSLDQYRWSNENSEEKCYRILDGNIGYITLETIQESDIKEIKEQFKETDGIIIDIRNYPSYFVPFELGSYFTSKTVDFVKFSIGNPNNPGEFAYSKPIRIKGEKNNYKGKLVVLVNAESQSQAEYTTMAFRAADNTVIVGSQTAGADGDVSEIKLPGGLFTWISGIGVYYPDGTATQRIGIVPDIQVLPTIEGIKSGRDEVLEKAIEVILK